MLEESQIWLLCRINSRNILENIQKKGIIMKKILKNSTYLWILASDMLSNFGDVVYYLAFMNYIARPKQPASDGYRNLFGNLP